MDYDAFLLLSFGGPEGLDDVMPFLRNVTRKRNVPDERLQVVAQQYELFNGISPINQHCRDLLDALSDEFDRHKITLPMYWGNRNWSPYLDDAVSQMAAAGVKNALVFTTSAFSSYSGCRQYRENIEEAQLSHTDLSLHKLRLFYNHPGFLEPAAANIKAALDRCRTEANQEPRLVFTAHSIPLSMSATSEYEDQLHEAATIVADLVGVDKSRWDLAFQSRSGPPQMPWLEPDINDHLEQLATSGTQAVVVAPIGFVSDHMEVLFDLDTQAKQTAQRLGLTFVRAKTVGTNPRFVSMIRELVQERTESAPRRSLGSSGPWPDDCPENHCLPSRRPPSSSVSGA